MRNCFYFLTVLITLFMCLSCYNHGNIELADYVATEVRDHWPESKFKFAIRGEWQELEKNSDHYYMTINVSHKDYEAMYAFASRQQKQTPFLTIYFFSVAKAAIDAGSLKNMTKNERQYLVAEYQAEPSPIYFRQFPKGFKNAKKQHAFGPKDFPQ